MSEKNTAEISERLKTIACKSTVFYNYKVTDPNKAYEIGAFRNFYESEFDETPKKKLSDDEIREIIIYMYQHPASSPTLLRIFPSGSRGIVKLGLTVFALLFIFIIILILV